MMDYFVCKIKKKFTQKFIAHNSSRVWSDGQWNWSLCFIFTHFAPTFRVIVQMVDILIAINSIRFCYDQRWGLVQYSCSPQTLFENIWMTWELFHSSFDFFYEHISVIHFGLKIFLHACECVVSDVWCVMRICLIVY